MSGASPRLPVLARLRRRRRLLGLVLGTLGALSCHQLWLPWIGGYLIVAERLRSAAALVPLAGDAARVDYAAELWQAGYAPTFVATNMRLADRRWGEFSAIVTRQALAQGVPAERIVVAPGTATTTHQEALILRRFALSQGWRSLLVVTSPSHTRRAGLILRDVFDGTGIDLLVVPVADHWYTARSWWHTRQGWRETGLEYVKLVLYQLGYHRLDGPVDSTGNGAAADDAQIAIGY